MSRIKIKTKRKKRDISISTYFINNVMPRINGEFVKIYLTLISILENGEDFSIEDLCDRLILTEKDIIRGLKTLEKEELLKSEIVDGAIVNLELILDMDKDFIKESKGKIEFVKTYSYVSEVGEEDNKDIPIQIERKSIDENSDDYMENLYKKKEYSLAEKEEFSKKKDFKELLGIIQVLLKKTISSREIETLIYLYDVLEMSADLIIYLTEYCIDEKNVKSISYMEKVAISWKKDGINTVERAKLSTKNTNLKINKVLKALGTNRDSVSPSEIEKVREWINSPMSLEVILEACKRTVLKTGQSSYTYTDGILKNWAKENVLNMRDVNRVTKEYSEKNKDNKGNNRLDNFNYQVKKNPFNAYDQREYTKEESDAIEEMLIKSTKEKHGL